MTTILVVGAGDLGLERLASLIGAQRDVITLDSCAAAVGHLRASAPPELVLSDFSRWNPDNLRVLQHEFPRVACVDARALDRADGTAIPGRTPAADGAPTQETERSNAQHTAEDLLLVLAHDLRAAVAVMGAYSAALLSEAAPLAESARSKLERIRNTSERLVGTVDDIVQVMWRGPVGGLHFEPSTPHDLMHAAAQDLAGAAEARQHTVTCKLDGDDEARPVDRNLVLLVLRNLLHNAIKYTHPGGAITVRGRTLGDGLAFTVQDNGRGLEPAIQRTLFDQVQKVFSPTGQSGSGIGLWSAKKVVELHGGSIWVDSTPGRGSVFGFTVRAGGHAGSQDSVSHVPPRGAATAS